MDDNSLHQPYVFLFVSRTALISPWSSYVYHQDPLVYFDLLCCAPPPGLWIYGAVLLWFAFILMHRWCLELGAL